MPSQRQRKLDAVVAGLQLRYGAKVVARAPEVRPEPVLRIPTTFAQLDAALAEGVRTGVGGLPRGRITEITGAATSGKVTLAAKTLAAAHRERGALVAWLDLSRTCDPDYFRRCGLDLDRLLIVRPAAAEDALAIAVHLVESNTLAALVFDGIADLPPESEALLAGTLPRLATAVTATQTAVIFLSEPQATYRTLAHLASVRLSLRRDRWIQSGRDIRGYEGSAEIVKNKLGRPGAVVPIRITFDGTVQGDDL